MAVCTGDAPLNGAGHEGNMSGQGSQHQILCKYSKQGKERNVLPPERSDSHGARPRRHRWRGRAHDHLRKLRKPVGLQKRQACREIHVNIWCSSTHRFFLLNREADFKGYTFLLSSNVPLPSPLTCFQSPLLSHLPPLFLLVGPCSHRVLQLVLESAKLFPGLGFPGNVPLLVLPMASFFMSFIQPRIPLELHILFYFLS